MNSSLATSNYSEYSYLHALYEWWCCFWNSTTNHRKGRYHQRHQPASQIEESPPSLPGKLTPDVCPIAFTNWFNIPFSTIDFEQKDWFKNSWWSWLSSVCQYELRCGEQSFTRNGCPWQNGEKIDIHTVLKKGTLISRFPRSAVNWYYYYYPPTE